MVSARLEMEIDDEMMMLIVLHDGQRTFGNQISQGLVLNHNV